MKTIVSGLWVGETLAPLAELTIKSWLAHGFDFQLFTYQNYHNIPEGTTRRDANEIIAEKDIWQHRSGSYGPFADLFRYTLLEREGGWWSDMDVVCLTDTLPNVDMWAARQADGRVAIGMLYFKAHDRVVCMLKKIAEDPATPVPWDSIEIAFAKRRSKLMDPDIRTRQMVARWGTTGPDAITAITQHLSLEAYVAGPETIYPLDFHQYEMYFNGTVQLDAPIFANALAIHVWGEILRRYPDAMTNLHPDSIIAKLFRKYDIAYTPDRSSGGGFVMSVPTDATSNTCLTATVWSWRDYWGGGGILL